jgi:demethylmenaquinone methyltransferase/2-methoxy-6-polyprenyl-1,4-benzoquinol methylase
MTASDASPEMEAYYAARAPYYDAVYLKPERRGDIAFLAAYLPARLAGRDVIEIACGTGYWTQHIAPHAARMVAIDLTAEPLELARLRPGIERVTYLRADAYALPDHVGVFDGAFAGLWLSHVPIASRAPFVAGLHRHLQPGARVIVIDNNEVQLNDFPIVETDGDGNTYQLRTLRDGTVHRVLKNFPGEEELRALVDPFARTLAWRNLENFWLLEYEVR